MILSLKIRAACLVVLGGCCAFAIDLSLLRADEGASESRREQLLSAAAHMKAGKLLQAERLYRKVLDQTSTELPGDRQVRVACECNLFDIYFRLGHYDKATRFGLKHKRHLLEHPHAQRLQTTNLRIAESYYALAHYSLARKFAEELLSMSGSQPLDPVEKMQALTLLANVAQQRGEVRTEKRRWDEAEQFGKQILGKNQGVLRLRDQIALGLDLAVAMREQKKFAEAIAQLDDLLTLQSEHNYHTGRREVLAEMATHYQALGNHSRAAECLRQALEIQNLEGQSGELLTADLFRQLAAVLNEQGLSEESHSAALEASTRYRAILQRSANEQHDSLEAMNAFWNLKDLYRDTNQFRQAVDLVSEQPWNWTSESLLETRLTSEEGALQSAVGSYRQARQLLQESLRYRRNQDPLNLNQLPRTLNNLALVEQAMGNVAEARTLCNECVALYEKYELPPNRDLAESYNLLATSAALEAKYSSAVALFRQGLEICDRLGEEAEGQRSNLLLNLAKTYKSQGRYDEAISQCREALTLYESIRSAEIQSRGIAAVNCALATMHIAKQDFNSAREHAERTLALYRKHDLQDQSLAIAAQHCLAIVHLVHKDFDVADELWQSVLSKQREMGQNSLTVRTLNYLAATAQLRGDLETAESHYRAALATHNDDSTIYPVMRFVSLWKLAQIRYRNGDETESRALLDRAIAIAESTRVGTYGAEKQRADFFAQFAPAFDAVFHLSLSEGDFDAALSYAERSRSRTFLDQLQVAGIDPRDGLEGETAQALLAREAALKLRINQIRARAYQTTQNDSIDDLKTELSVAQQEYTRLWEEILDASPIYRSLLVKNLPRWSESRAAVMSPGSLMLYYYLGRNRSYLILIGEDGRTPEVYLLEIPAGYPSTPRIPESESDRNALRLAGTRGIVRRREEKALPQPQSRPNDHPTPLNRQLARQWVDAYLEQLVLEGGASLRGIKRRRSSVVETEPITDATMLTNILLPQAVRKRIRDLSPERLIVIPDGALHQLPLESLLISEGSERRYVLDEFPPIAYAPSVGVLAALSPHTSNDSIAETPATLLTIGDPAYREAEATVPHTDLDLSAEDSYLHRVGHVTRLPNTAEECHRIAALFDQKHVTLLQGENASESQFLRALSGQRYLHFAAHAFVDHQHNNRLGGILLTPPLGMSAAEEGDGVLTLNEIYTLPLNHCELAVLSACETNVGPHESQEVGFSLARAFFKAGARRVVASHWTVEDASTAELVGTFFEEITNAAGAGQSVDYAVALQNARRRVRNDTRWAHPFFWASFVLIGPAQEQIPSVLSGSKGRIGELSRSPLQRANPQP